MVGAGAAGVVVGAQAASSSYCGSFGCVRRQTPNTTWAPSLALAGAAVAAAGYALMFNAPRSDVRPPSSGAGPSSPGDAWRLRRKEPVQKVAQEPPSEETEEAEGR